MSYIGKAQIVAQMSQRTGLSREQSQEVYACLVDIVQEQLRRGQRVSLTGIGVLSLIETKGVKGTKRLLFQASDELRDSVKQP